MARRRGAELDTRAALVEAACELFATAGYEVTSVAAVIERAGLSKGTFFHYFPSKLELLDAVCDQLSERAWAETRAALEVRGASAVKTLNRFLGSSRRWRAENAAFFMETWRLLARDENVLLRQRLQRRTLERATPALAAVISRGVESGEFHVGDPGETARLLLELSQTAADANLRLLVEGGEGAELPKRLARRLDALTTAFERILGTSEGILERPDEKALARLCRALRTPLIEGGSP